MNDELLKRIDKVYGAYIDVIFPLSLQLEIMQGEFPVEILNEIRAIFTHLARVYALENADQENNIRSAESHIKRAILDCYKYLCVAYTEKYQEFRDLYKRADLNVVEDGKFLSKLLSIKKEASDAIVAAKTAELRNVDNDQIYDLYEKAYGICDKMGAHIDGASAKCERANFVAKRRLTIQIIIGVAGIIGTVFGIIQAIVT